jgi:hypothetical protein
LGGSKVGGNPKKWKNPGADFGSKQINVRGGAGAPVLGAERAWENDTRIAALADDGTLVDADPTGAMILAKETTKARNARVRSHALHTRNGNAARLNPTAAAPVMSHALHRGRIGGQVLGAIGKKKSFGQAKAV